MNFQKSGAKLGFWPPLTFGAREAPACSRVCLPLLVGFFGKVLFYSEVAILAKKLIKAQKMYFFCLNQLFGQNGNPWDPYYGSKTQLDKLYLTK